MLFLFFFFLRLQERERDRNNNSSPFYYFEYLVSRNEALQCRRAARLNGRHEDAHLIATSNTNADRTFFLKTDEPRIQPNKKSNDEREKSGAKSQQQQQPKSSQIDHLRLLLIL